MTINRAVELMMEKYHKITFGFSAVDETMVMRHLIAKFTDRSCDLLDAEIDNIIKKGGEKNATT